jgi:PTH1 family peptidyl-tRNA hydrolase
MRKVIDGKKDLEKIIVLHDDMDLPIGSIKLSYARGSGGHQGVESIIAHIKSNGPDLRFSWSFGGCY